MSCLSIGEKTRVFLNWAIHLEDGEQVDSNFDRSPVSFVIGDGSLLDGFERCLLGLCAGDEAEFQLDPKEAFGQPRTDNIQTLPRSQFLSEQELNVGMVYSFADAAGGELPGVIEDFNDDEVRVNFNHPLAGRTLKFLVRIDRVEAEEVH